jgi:hypothetical protein
VAVQHTAIHQEQFSAVLYKVTSATQTIQTAPAVLFVIMEVVQDHAALKPTAATSTSVADLAAPHSGPAIPTAHALHSIILLFLLACLPVTAAWSLLLLKQITDFQSGQEWDSISSARASML